MEELNQFVKYKKKMKESYSPVGTNLRTGRSAARGLTSLNNPEQGRETLQRSVTNPAEYESISRTLNSTNPLFESIVSYYKTLSYYRYTVTPVLKKGKVAAGNYQEIYERMMSVVDGMSIETTYPYLIGELLLSGVIYIYTVGDKSSEVLDTILLPRKYCRPGQRTSYGTFGIDFDMNFFKETESKLNKSSQSGVVQTIDDVLASLPKEFAAGYQEFLKDSNKRWIALDSRFAASFRLNDDLISTMAFLLNPINEYEKIKQNELTRSNNDIVNILAHQIPNYEGKLLLEVDEVNDIHEGMSAAFEGETGFKLLTTFGNTELLSLQKTSSAESKTREQAYRTVYNDSGIGADIFNSNTKESIEMTLARDESKIQLLINELTLFYRIALNNIFNFANYQLEFDILSINRYNYNSRIKEFNFAASLGVGKLQYMVACGMKQSSIPSQIELENYLKLEDLKPFSTSYTQAGKKENGRPEGSTESGESSDGL